MLLTYPGQRPTYPETPPQPEYDLIGYDKADSVARRVLPFELREGLAGAASSEEFPYRYEADGLPHQSAPHWLLRGPGSSDTDTTLQVRDGVLHMDTLSPEAPGAVMAQIPRGPDWDVEGESGYTVEARLRVTASNANERFAFWLETNNERRLLTLQIHPDRITAAGNEEHMLDMASDFRTVRVVCLPGGEMFQVYVDGEALEPDFKGLGGMPFQSSVGFGAGASAGKIRAEVDYVRYHPSAALAPAGAM
jgi:hypothetical protein